MNEGGNFDEHDDYKLWKLQRDRITKFFREAETFFLKKEDQPLFFSGSRILGVTVSKEQMYPMKLKGISICFSMLKAALCGSYVNFGVFRLYGDDALDNALNSFVKLLLSIPQSDLLVTF